MNEEFHIPVSCKLSSAQAALLTEFVEHPGFEGKVGGFLSPSPHHSVRESTSQEVANGISMLIDGENRMPFGAHQALNNWLQNILKPDNVKYLKTTVCHSTNESDLRAALNLIAAAVAP